MKLAQLAIAFATLLALASCRTHPSSRERADDTVPRADEIRSSGDSETIAVPAARRVRRDEEHRGQDHLVEGRHPEDQHREDKRVEVPRKPFVEPLLPANGPLQVPFDPVAPPTMLDLVRAYERVTDMRFVMRSGGVEALKAIPVGVDGPLEIARNDVQMVFERMLVNQGLVLSIVHAGRPFLLSMDSIIADRLLPRALPVDVRDLDSFADHPALMIGTVLPLENVQGDDAGGWTLVIAKMLAASPIQVVSSRHAVLLSGRANDVRSWVGWLREMDRAGAAPVDSSGSEVSR